MAEDERFQKLKEKYNQIKQANTALKKGFLDKQEECNRLEEQIKEKESTIRQQLEEIDRLQYQNSRMTKQVSTLNAQVEEQKKTHTQSTWSMGGLISGKQQEAVQKAESDLAVLRDELMMKIQENEELHMRVFEAQKQHNEEAERLRDTEASRGRDLERYSAQLKSSKEEVERLGIENKRMVERIGTLDHQLSASAQLSESLREQLDKERAESLSTKQALQRRFTRWVPFDWTQHDLWTGFSLSSHQGRMAKQRQQALQDLYSAVQEACRHCCGALQTWPSVLIGGAEEESAAQLRVRVKVADVAKDLAGCITRVVPLMAEMFGKGGLVDDQRQELRRYSNELVMIHRRWVLYQSVLLHHWQSTSGRSSQEEALAQSFVDCLWRLHRCVRSLIARLRVATLLPDLSTGNSSAAHFALARRKLSRKGGGAVDQKPPGIQAAERLGLVQRSLSDVSHCWKALGRCLSSWAAAQAGGSTVTTSSNTSQASGGGVVGLLGCIHGLCACLNERVLPMVEKLAMQAPGPHEMPLLLSTSAKQQFPEVHGLGLYADAVKKQLENAPDVIGMQECFSILTLSRRLSASRVQLLSELRQQAQRLQAVNSEKSQLSHELNGLQDRHALLQSNFDVMKAGQVAEPPDKDSVEPIEIPGSNELLLSSRQRALLGSLKVTTQESSGMRQHGFFVDVVSLDSGEASLAAGPPRPETLEAWELAVRKVYEQHVLRLQKQMLVADTKALEMGLNLQDFRDQIQQQEEEKQDLSDQVSATKSELNNLREDMEATRKNYDGQLGMLTEHICALSARLSEKDASLASLQANKVLCGRCGMWNTMGKLLAEPGAGTCQTCKEKVLTD